MQLTSWLNVAETISFVNVPLFFPHNNNRGINLSKPGQ
jgi:hypothetical protein